MVAVFVESISTDSELVIGSTPETTQNEILLVRQVQTRHALHQDKSERHEFTTPERWIDKCGERALTQLVKSHDRRICILVLKYQKNKYGSADVDLIQEAIATFIDAIYRFDSSKGAALYSYAYFRIQARLQQLTEKENHYKIAEAKSFAEEEGYSFSKLNDLYGQEQLNAALSRLPERQQEILWARQRDEAFSVIAERFQSSLKTVQNLFYSGLRKLRSLLGLSSTVAPITPQPEKVAPTQETQPEAVEVAQVELVAVSEPIVEPAIEPSLAELCPPETKPERKFKNIRAVFKILPITNSEAKQISEVSRRISRLHSLHQGIEAIVAKLKRPIQAFRCPPLQSLGDLMTATKARRTAHHSESRPQSLLSCGVTKPLTRLRQISENLPPWWLLLGLATVVVNAVQDPILNSIVVSLWLATFYLYGIQLLGHTLTLRLRHRKWVTSIGTAVIAFLSAPQLVFAQAAPGGGGCANAGFLNKLADFSTSVLTSNSGTAVTSLSNFMCQFIGMLALIAIIMVVGGFIYAGFEIIVRQQALATVAQPVVGIVVVVVFCVATIYIMTTPA